MAARNHTSYPIAIKNITKEHTIIFPITAEEINEEYVKALLPIMQTE